MNQEQFLTKTLSSKIFYAAMLLSMSFIGNAQTTFDYFTQEDISFSWLVGNIYDGYYATGLTYVGTI